MKTEQEIVERLRDKSDGGQYLFDFRREVWTSYLSPESVMEFVKLKEGVTEDEFKKSWEEESRSVLDRETLLKNMADYMAFAWEKAENHRGLSSQRSIQKMEAWLWLLGDDETLKAVEEAPYENYGTPKLAVICKRYELPIPQNEVVLRMVDGRPCGADYECGCGT